MSNLTTLRMEYSKLIFRHQFWNYFDRTWDGILYVENWLKWFIWNRIMSIVWNKTSDNIKHCWAHFTPIFYFYTLRKRLKYKWNIAVKWAFGFLDASPLGPQYMLISVIGTGTQKQYAWNMLKVNDKVPE